MKSLSVRQNLNRVEVGNKYRLTEEFSLRSVGGYLKQAFSAIRQLAENSEEQFLDTGSKLQSFLTKSKDLSKAASNTAESISDIILKKSITEINLLLGQFGQSLTESVDEIGTDKEELLSILSNVAHIIEGLEGFRKIVKHLRMLGISTKIESARLGDDDKGFNTLAENVEKLSNMISEKATAIHSKAALLQMEVIKTTKELEKLETSQKQQANVLVTNTTQTIGRLEKTYRDSSLKIDEIAKSSGEVSKNIGGIVTSIQFHDITRQQMEHVNEALEEAYNLIDWTQVSGIIDDDMEDKLAAIYNVCELQTFQFSNAITEFTEAIGNIIEKLSNVESNVTDIFSNMLHLFSEEGKTEKSSIGSVKNELDDILKGLKRNDEVSEQLSSSIKSVIEIVEDLSKYVLQIEEIGTEIEIIALNARIKAAHTGLNGLSLGVLAEEIQNLSIDAKAQTVSTTKILNEISVVSQKLKSNLDESVKKQKQKKTRESNEKILGLLNDISKLESITKRQIDTIRIEVNSFKEEINITVKEINAHHNNVQIVQEIIAKLNFISQGIKTNVDISTDREKAIINLKQRYTMEKERMIHDAFSEKKNIEAVGLNDTDEVHEENSLGDNVELF